MTDELAVTDLHVEVDGKAILKGLSLRMRKGEIVAVMGPNGSGKSTLANAILGNPTYTVTGGSIAWKGRDITVLKPDERSRMGLFLSFQYPQEISGVSITNFLRTALNAKRGTPISVPDFYHLLKEKMALLKIDQSFKDRYLNQGFSGGEKKRSEILQLAVLEPELAILDETDSGTDIDALKVISAGINTLKKKTGMGVLIITHYERILRYVKPDRVVVMIDGRVTREGDLSLALEIEKTGYGVPEPPA